ncbi:MAG: carotenoid oxygenase family protein, partial [Gammaproteobacteria bacterium]
MTAAPYIEGNYGPVSEEITAVELPVTGEIPRELVGRYLRNGPNPIRAVDPSSHHWFIGDGMVHGVRLDGGRADWYRNRWVRSERVIDALGESAEDRNLGDGPNTHVVG